MLAGWARALLELDEAALVRIAFRDEPLRGKLTEAMKQSLYEGARAEGEARAALLQEDGGALSLDEAAARWGVQVRDSNGSAAAGLGLFAVFHEPDIIEIDGQNAADTDDALQKAGVYETLGAVPTRNILLAHELYHFLAFRDGEGFTAQKHVTLWKLGRFAYKSSVPGLQEIAAMAFAQKATGLVCSPWLYNVFMLAPHNPQRALAVFESMTGKAE